MMDLSKYGKVWTCDSHGEANRWLDAGWELITVKIIEIQFRKHCGGNEYTTVKDAQTNFVLGKPREKKK